ncbi:MAG: CehA/McbA family metallohydrolase [Planctomycetota bacterium]|nr:CehA/McbA family metallohydrolase [Planctomycetota bacterium]
MAPIRPSRLVAVVAALAALAAPAATLQATTAPGQGSLCIYHVRSGPPCPPGSIDPPGSWYSGDTHEHVQLCFGPDVAPSLVLAHMIADDLDVSSPLIWGAGFITPDQYDVYTAQYVDGDEHPITQPLPDLVMQFGVETSGFSVAHLGHLIGLNIGQQEADIFQLGLGCAPIYPTPGWKNDGSGDYNRPIIDLFKQAPQAVIGYAHTTWPIDTHLDVALGGWDWEDPTLPAYVGFDAKCSFGKDMAFPIPKTCANTQPVMGPIDVVTRGVDFLEAFDLENWYCQPELEARWYGMYYKLLSAGLRPSISAGSDADCAGNLCKPRTWVLLKQGEALSYDTWTLNLKRGRVSLSTGGHQFLDLRVAGGPLGSEVDLVTPATGAASVLVEVNYHVNLTGGSSVSDTIEIVQNGEVVASRAFGPLSVGTVTFLTQVDVKRSGWIAARTKSLGTHTAAAFQILDGKPVAGCAEAEYFTLYCDYLTTHLDAAAGPELEFFVGCSEQEMRDHLEEGRRIFAALRDYDAPLPVGVERYGTSSPSECGEPMGMGVTGSPVAGAPFGLDCFNAPSNGSGFLLVGFGPLVPGVAIDGASIHVAPALPAIAVAADDGGYSAFHLDAMANMPGLDVYVQYAWANPSGCTSTGSWSSSDALKLTIQP